MHPAAALLDAVAPPLSIAEETTLRDVAGDLLGEDDVAGGRRSHVRSSRALNARKKGARPDLGDASTSRRTGTRKSRPGTSPSTQCETRSREASPVSYRGVLREQTKWRRTNVFLSCGVDIHTQWRTDEQASLARALPSPHLRRKLSPHSAAQRSPVGVVVGMHLHACTCTHAHAAREAHRATWVPVDPNDALVDSS